MIDHSSMTTDELLVLSQKYQTIADDPLIFSDRQFWLDSLVELDAELDSRAPVGEFRMLIDEAGQPVGFESMVDDAEALLLWTAVDKAQNEFEMLIRNF